MAIDNKYGRVTFPNGDIGEDEPIFVFRAQDKLLPYVLEMYYDLCETEECHVRHLEKIHESRVIIKEWQDKHFTKLPESL